MLPKECLDYYGLKDDPFQPPRKKEEFWAHPQFDKLTGIVRQTVHRGGFLCVVGPSGCGKTAAVRYALANLKGDPDQEIPRSIQYRVARLLTLRRHQTTGCSLARAMLRDLAPDERMPGNAESLAGKVVETISTMFGIVQLRIATLVIEEAHELAPATWLDLKKIREECEDAGGVLGVICIGQSEAKPSMEDTLNKPALVSVRRRLFMFRVVGLTAGQARAYIEHRLSWAEAKTTVILPEAVEHLIDTIAPARRGSIRPPIYPAVLDTWLSMALVEGWDNRRHSIDRGLMSYVLTAGAPAKAEQPQA